MDRDTQIEAVTSAHRARDARGRVQSHPSWHDLSEEDRVLAAEATEGLRRLEAALDPEGLSSTVRAVLERLIR